MVKKSDGCWLWQGRLNTEGYARFKTDSGTIAAHRFAWQTVNGPIPPGYQIDHICHTPACVRPDHLRPAEPGWNSAYRQGPNSNNISGYRGVTWHKASKKWRARVGHMGKNYDAGAFDDPYQAHLAVVAKRRELHHWESPDNGG
ncbi:HNH endonuclease [Kocuria sabuli]|uniref:HNH endonuclease n=1 Tax=Kocuria sabuli TaxID=3071448 RepID=UPI0034D74E5E